MPIELYKERPKQVEVVQFTGNNYDEVENLVGSTRYNEHNGSIFIMTVDGFRDVATVGSYIVKYSPGRYDVFSEEKFNLNYEKV